MSPAAKAPSDPAEISLPPGTRKVRLRAELPSGVGADVRIEARSADGEWAEVGQLPLNGPDTPPRSPWREILDTNWDQRLLWLALAVYLAIRLTALPAFPIYFFSDEAIQSLLASDLVRDGFHGYSGDLLPTYFPNGGQYNLSASVYTQVLPYMLFGKSIWVTRGVPALLSLLAALAVARALRDALGIRRAWLGVLLLSAAPAWFLHSRTAFETSLAVSFYAVFLCAYLLYRSGRTAWLYVAVSAAALTFYTYSPAQMVVVASGVLFFFSDLRYHWEKRKAALVALGMVALFIIPYIRHQFLHPGSELEHLSILNSYLTAHISLVEKLAKAASIFFNGLNPLYWFLPNEIDIPRHTMLGWGHLLRWTLPFYLAGLGLAAWRIRRPIPRALLLSLLACPVGAIPVDLGVTRVLFLVIPASLLSAIGLDATIELLGRLRGWLRRPAAGLSYAALWLTSPLLLISALVDGPRWYNDYGLSGMQYGAQQVFGVIRQELKSQPDQAIVLSPTWANSTDILARYFLGDPMPVRIDSIRAFSEQYTPFDAGTLFVLPVDEFQSISPDIFSKVDILRVIYYPNDTPGFYFVHLAYSDQAEQIVKAHLEEAATPIEEIVIVDGQQVPVLHTQLDMGDIKDVFDGSPNSLTRSANVNPYVVNLRFPSPRHLSGLTLRVGGVATEIAVRAVIEGEDKPRDWTVTLPEDPLPRDAQLDFGASLAVKELDISIKNSIDPPQAHVHLWEVTLR